jgi:hypothetical protein
MHAHSRDKLKKFKSTFAWHKAGGVHATGDHNNRSVLPGTKAVAWGWLFGTKGVEC